MVSIVAAVAASVVSACGGAAPPEAQSASAGGSGAGATSASSDSSQAATAPQGGDGHAAPPPGPATVSDKECPADFTVDDAEDNNNQVIVQKGRKGYWYTFVDKAGTTLTPPAGTKFIMSAGGPKDSKHAARMMGKVSGSGDPLFAGMGFSFTDPKGPYDATAYTGVSFYAKVGPGSTKTVRLKVPDADTDPAGKKCTECFNDFGQDLTLTEQWKKYTVPFAAMKQMEGWGSPNPATVDKSTLFGLQWQVTQQGAAFDVWVDDVQLTGCP
jgi:endoglucanase